MAGSVLVDAGFLVALLSRRDGNHGWAAAQPSRFPPPWKTCEAVLSEAFHLLGAHGGRPLTALLRRRAVVPAFELGADVEPVLKLLDKYADVPMSLADACLVRMTETVPAPCFSPRMPTFASTAASHEIPVWRTEISRSRDGAHRGVIEIIP